MTNSEFSAVHDETSFSLFRFKAFFSGQDMLHVLEVCEVPFNMRRSMLEQIASDPVDEPLVEGRDSLAVTSFEIVQHSQQIVGSAEKQGNRVKLIENV